jgi:hypothetical protein
VTPYGRNVLLLLLGDVAPAELRDGLARLPEPVGRVHVVAPALVRALDWLATAEDKAQRQAEVRVLEAEWTLSGWREVDGEAGDPDPVQAVEDALRAFSADLIVIAGPSAVGELDAELARFGLPLRRLQPPPASPSALSRALRGLATGRSDATPFVLFLGVNGVLALVAALLSALALLVLWLLGGL